MAAGFLGLTAHAWADSPSIVSFSPSEGPAGTSVAVAGSGFTGTTDVEFGGVSDPTFSVVDDSLITATVPPGATTGPILVTTPEGTASSADNFTVTVSPPTPVIDGFTPTQGPVGTPVSVAGSGLAGATDVQFNGVSSQSFSVIDDTRVDATVPPGAATGPISVITPDGTATSPGDFTVTVPPPTPVIDGFTPTQGPVGTPVSVAGSALAGATDVQFNGVSSASFSVIDDTRVDATVPPGAMTGPISVITPDGTATSADNFTVTVTLAITDFQPKGGPVGTTVTISGANFTGATDIQFAGISVHGKYSVRGDAEITASVPAGASSGSIMVVTPSGTVDSSEDFSVDPPNILFVLTDDQRWDELDYMPILQSELIAKGVKLSNGFASHPLCAPSRATLLTGSYSGVNGVWSNVSENHGGFEYFNDTTTIATALHDRGYHTALIGKYLNGYGNDQVAYVPPGWDRWFAFTQNQFFGPSVSDQGMLSRWGSITYQTTLLGQKAVQFIASAPPSQPLFLYWAPHAPHLPSSPHPNDAGTLGGVLTPWRPPSYNEADVSDKPLQVQATPLWTAKQRARIDSDRERMYESLIDVDRWLGQILQALEDTGRLENTLIVFISDNGYLWGEHRLTEKAVAYEESIRVPYIVRWDGAGWNAPSTDARLMVNIDFAPTVAAAAGTTMAGAQGADLLPLLNDPVGAGWRSDFLIEGNLLLDKVNAVYCGVRSELFTYVQYLSGEEELYDLQADPYQLQNVASQESYGDVLTQMRQRDHELCDPPPPNWTWTH